MIERIDELLGRPVRMRPLALLRIAVGLIAFQQLRMILATSWYTDRFTHPVVSWYPILPRWGWSLLLHAGLVAALAFAAGALTRISGALTALACGYHLLVSTTNFHNNRTYVVYALVMLTASRCGAELSVDAAIRRSVGRPIDRTGPAWPWWLLRFEASTIYLASGTSKLLDHHWWSGTVTWDRLVNQRHTVEASLPHWAVDVLLDRSFHTVAAKVIIALELFLGLGLWWRRTRPAAAWMAIAFHVSIELSASVEGFSELAIAALVIWVVPDRAPRPIAVRTGRTRRLLHALDWLAQYDVTVDQAAPRRGVAEWAAVGIRLPATFVVALPTATVARLGALVRPPVTPAAALPG